MKDIYKTAKRRVLDTLGTHPTNTVPEDAVRLHKEFPSENDLYCYRKQRGVNLGGHLLFSLKIFILDACRASY